jgi:hypothetical protein
MNLFRNTTQIYQNILKVKNLFKRRKSKRRRKTIKK